MSNHIRYQFGKESRLKSRKEIQRVFSAGQSIFSPSLKAVWIHNNPFHQLQAGISVSSRNFKKAVDRNRVKRLIRESYRLQKHGLEEKLIQHQLSVSIFFIYVGKELPTQQQMHEAVLTIINKLINRFDEKNKTTS